MENKKYPWTTLSLKPETLEEMIKSKARIEMKTGKSITWDDFLLALVKHDKDIESFI